MRPSLNGSNFAVDEATQLNSAEATPGRVIPVDLAGNPAGMGVCGAVGGLGVPRWWCPRGSTFPPPPFVSVFGGRSGSERWVHINDL